MYTKTSIVLTDEDKYILRNVKLPDNPCIKSDNPCIKCGIDIYSCTGCHDYTEYKKAIKIYEDKGLDDYMRTIKSINSTNKLIQESVQRRNEMFYKLPVEIREVVNNLISE